MPECHSCDMAAEVADRLFITNQRLRTRAGCVRQSSDEGDRDDLAAGDGLRLHLED